MSESISGLSSSIGALFLLLLLFLLYLVLVAGPPLEHRQNDEDNVQADHSTVEGKGTRLGHGFVVVVRETLEDGQAKVEPRLEVGRIHVAELGLDKPEYVVVSLLAAQHLKPDKKR